MLSYEAARQKVAEIAQAHVGARSIEKINILSGAGGAAIGRVLAENVLADRDYPPFNRSVRDGFAVRAADVAKVPAELKRVGEVKAGEAFAGTVGVGECVQIMTGAPVPAGADAVVMIEYTNAAVGGDAIRVDRVACVGDHIVPAGSEVCAGDVVLERGTRLGYAELAMAAQVGHVELSVYPRARVAILSTGDEVVAADATPAGHEIRNSNAVSLAAQIALQGGEPVALGNARDEIVELRRMIELGLAEDILVLSGGVSMGKYDLVEDVLRELGAEIFFDAVAIRPGRPAVFGTCRGKLVFGLPGNPVSTMVTCELLVAPAIDILSGGSARPLPLLQAKLRREVCEKPGLAHFIPASVEFGAGEANVEPVPWQGSGDIVAVVDANCFLVVPPTREIIAAGEWVDVLLRRGVF